MLQVRYVDRLVGRLLDALHSSGVWDDAVVVVTADHGAVRTIDVLPTIAKAAGIQLPWKAHGMPADERLVDPGAAIDVSHQGKLILTEPLSEVQAKRGERDELEAGLLRDGVYAIGPRPDLIGRDVEARGRRLDVDLSSPLLPAFITGRAPGLKAETVIAIVVNGRVAQTTRVYGRSSYAALVPPSSLRAGVNTVAVVPVAEL